jgi:hypothetical protein
MTENELKMDVLTSHVSGMNKVYSEASTPKMTSGMNRTQSLGDYNSAT